MKKAFIQIILNTHKKDDNKKNTLLIILCLTFGTLSIIMLFLFFSFSSDLKKNKNLKGKIESISFTRGIEEDFHYKMDNNTKSKNEEDYENTFI